MSIKQSAAPFIIGLSALCIAAPMAHAAEEIVAVETVSSAPYMNGGIGKDEQDRIRGAAREFNLRMEFSEGKNNAFVTDVGLSVADLQGNPVFYLPSAGPMTNVRLPDGKYKVTATMDRHSEVQTVALAKGQPKSIFFHWAD